MGLIEAVDPRTRGLAGRAEERVPPGTFLRQLDWVLMIAVAATVGYGLWAIAGITRHDITGNPNYYLVRQGAYAGVGAVGLLVLLFVDPDLYRRYKKVLYGGLCGVMLLVLLAGEVSRHSKRWLDLGPFRFQPSEFGKLFLVLVLAGFLADRGRRVSQTGTVLAVIGLAAGPMLLVYVQPDLGTTLVYAAGLVAVLFAAGTRWSHLTALGLLTVGSAVLVLWALPAAGIHVLKDYQVARLTGFTNPSQDPAGVTYNIHESLIAVGAGGVNGRGTVASTQTNLGNLPAHNTDFAFASLAEQRGFVGCAVLLLLYLLVVWRGLKVMAVARDSFSAIAAGGIVVALLFQIFVNVGMTMGIAPITGIPLPFVSVGGSSMIANLLAIGVLQAIYARGYGRRARA
jgi:rod shape determining protein RodA